jgi:hypothetical protein
MYLCASSAGGRHDLAGIFNPFNVFKVTHA